MNRKSKVIVSIVGITIVLLALLGLTYAYYLTRIEGNTNTNSISVTTAKLELVYGDNSAEIITSTSVLMPKVGTDAIDAIGTKAFTVTNNGNDSSYVVIIDNVSIKNVSDNTDTNFFSNDFRYTLSCVVKDKGGNILEGETCNKVTNLDVFPIKGGVLVGNNIQEDKVHEYTLALWYIDTGVDQSDDMGKSYQARVNIKDMTATNPFQTGTSATNTTSLVYNIINNAKENKNGTQFVNSPITSPAESAIAVKFIKGIEPTSFTLSRTGATNRYITYSDDYIVNETDGKFTLRNKDGSTPVTIKYTGTDMAETLKGKYAYWSILQNSAMKVTNIDEIYKISTLESDFTSNSIKYANMTTAQTTAENILTVTKDDYGTSYYFRGGVIDNYVNFAGMCWRIVRIEGDGSTKLILEDLYTECNDSSYTGNWSDDYHIYFGKDIDITNLINQETGLIGEVKKFQTNNLTSLDLQKLKEEEWCYDDKVTELKGWGYAANWERTEIENEAINGWYIDKYYGAYTRIVTNKKPSLNCSGTKITKYKDGTNMYVGSLTVDEMAFAGATFYSNSDFYLINDYTKHNYKHFWSFSLYGIYDETPYRSSFLLYKSGKISIDTISSSEAYFRPTVTLKAGTTFVSGEGTLGSPYVIE